MWRARLSKTWDWLRSRRLVGEDEHHLFFSEFVESGKPERRYVEYKDRNITHSSDRMPIEWWSWLHNRRDVVPTTLELAASETARHRLAERVAVLEAEDERERLRQMSGLSQAAGGGTGEAAVQEEVQAKRRRKVLLRLHNAATSAVPNGGGGVSPDGQKGQTGSTEAVDDFEPESWTPSSSSKRRSG